MPEELDWTKAQDIDLQNVLIAHLINNRDDYKVRVYQNNNQED